MEATIDRLVRMLDEERVARRQSEERRSDAVSQLMDATARIEAARKVRNEAQADVRKWQQWRDEVKKKTDSKIVGKWPTTPDNDDIPF